MGFLRFLRERIRSKRSYKCQTQQQSAEEDSDTENNDLAPLSLTDRYHRLPVELQNLILDHYLDNIVSDEVLRLTATNAIDHFETPDLQHCRSQAIVMPDIPIIYNQWLPGAPNDILIKPLHRIINTTIFNIYNAFEICKLLSMIHQEGNSMSRPHPKVRINAFLFSDIDIRDGYTWQEKVTMGDWVKQTNAYIAEWIGIIRLFRGRADFNIYLCLPMPQIALLAGYNPGFSHFSHHNFEMLMDPAVVTVEKISTTAHHVEMGLVRLRDEGVPWVRCGCMLCNWHSYFEERLRVQMAARLAVID